jgi:formylmethanofuran dehydrogenase subunit E
MHGDDEEVVCVGCNGLFSLMQTVLVDNVYLCRPCFNEVEDNNDPDRVKRRERYVQCSCCGNIFQVKNLMTDDFGNHVCPICPDDKVVLPEEDY